MIDTALRHSHHFWLPLLITGGLCLLTAWLGQLAETPLVRDAAGFAHDPDYFVEHFQATAFDAQGRPRYRLAAERMQHYMDDDTTVLEAPRFGREGPGVAPVQVQSRRGLVSPEGESVYFLGDVRMQQNGAGDRPPLQLSTEYLRVIPEGNIIRTDRPVMLSEGSSRLTATGMVADGGQRSLIFAGRVKGIYESRH